MRTVAHALSPIKTRAGCIFVVKRTRGTFPRVPPRRKLAELLRDRRRSRRGINARARDASPIKQTRWFVVDQNNPRRLHPGRGNSAVQEQRFLIGPRSVPVDRRANRFLRRHARKRVIIPGTNVPISKSAAGRKIEQLWALGAVQKIPRLPVVPGRSVIADVIPIRDRVSPGSSASNLAGN